MDKNKNYYQILHVQSDAPSEVIRSTYRTMMQKMKMHPDLGGDQEDAALINEAYAVLMDVNAREKYDASLKLQQNTKTQTPGKTKQAPQSQSHFVFDPHQCAFCSAPNKLGSTVEQDRMCGQCGGALFPATKHKFESDGNRIIQRIDKQWPVFFYTELTQRNPHKGQTHDISLNGMQLVTNVNVSAGVIIKLSSHHLEAVARVVNVRDDHKLLSKRWRIGVEFLTLKFHQTQGTFLRVNA